jgi:hypothetical protein
MQKHSCGQSTMLEVFLFDSLYSSFENPDLVPDDDCCICLLPLKQDAPKETGCCGRYSRKTNCGHWMHVSCLICCPTKTKCPICSANLVDDNLMKMKSQRSKICNALPSDYKKMYLKDGLEIFLDENVINKLKEKTIDAQYIYAQLKPWHDFFKQKKEAANQQNDLKLN